jgi:putative transposase
MSRKYKFSDREGLYFVTATTVNWIDVFTRNCYKDILLDSFRFCQINQGLQIHAWVLMPNHFHMICSFLHEYEPGLVLKNIKSYTAIKIIDAIIKNQQESRKDFMLDVFEKHGKYNKSNYRFQFWQHENHPVLLDTNQKIGQRLNYVHDNPVRSGFVSSPEHWLYSSAVDYYTDNQKGLLELVMIA